MDIVLCNKTQQRDASCYIRTCSANAFIITISLSIFKSAFCIVHLRKSLKTHVIKCLNLTVKNIPIKTVGWHFTIFYLQICSKKHSINNKTVSSGIYRHNYIDTDMYIGVEVPKGYL